MADKFMPADCDHGAYFRARAEGHAPGYDIAVFARPAQWVAVADHIDRITAENVSIKIEVAKLATAEARATMAENEASAANQRCDRITAERDVMQERVTEWHDRCLTAENVIDRLTVERDELLAQRDALNGDVWQLGLERSALRMALDDLNNAVNHLWGTGLYWCLERNAAIANVEVKQRAACDALAATSRDTND